MSESKRWESKLDDISSAKLKLDTELIGIQFDANGKVELEEAVKKVTATLEAKIEDLKSVAFGGAVGENVYKFRDKFLEAIAANQLREKDKVGVLRKHIKNDAKQVIGDHFKTLIRTYFSKIL